MFHSFLKTKVEIYKYVIIRIFLKKIIPHKFVLFSINKEHKNKEYQCLYPEKKRYVTSKFRIQNHCLKEKSKT